MYAEIAANVNTMYTDTTKIRKTDPGHPETCPVFFFQQSYNAGGAPEIARRCRAGELGCVEDKADMARRLNTALAPIRERLRELAARPDRVDEILHEGTKRARAVAQTTLAEVKAAMGLS